MENPFKAGDTVLTKVKGKQASATVRQIWRNEVQVKVDANGEALWRTNDPNARFVIQIGTTLVTASNSSVLLINQADARNVYFLAGTSVTLGSGSTFIGSLLAGASVTAVSGTNLTGRLLALTGAVTLDTNNVTNPALTSPTPTPSPTPSSSPTQLLNISTRLNVQTGEKVSIAGFIITGNASKNVIIRGIGPSLVGLTPLLADPVLELHGGIGANGAFITTNDNWKDTQQAAIQATGIPPTNDLESAIVATLLPGAYTAILSGKNGTTGIGLAEVYDLDSASDSTLANISTRGFVQTGDEVMIGGFILGDGTTSANVLIRALGPSIPGIADVLADPTLQLFDGNGTLLVSNDNWQDDPLQKAAILATGIPPTNSLESAIVVTLPTGAYTAIVSGKDNGTGVALAEVYHLP